MNPFKKVGEYFSAKPPRQRVLAIIGFVLLAVFVFFLIKGNFFDARKNISSENSYSESGEISDESENEAPPTQTERAKFHVSVFDIVILVVIGVCFAVKIIRGKIKNRRM